MQARKQGSSLPVQFPIQLFVPQAIYAEYGDKSFWFVDWRIIWTVEAIASHFGRQVRGNDWHIPGGHGFQYRGFRPPLCDVGTPLSQHRFGRGQDIDVIGISAEDVRKEILTEPTAPAFKYITCLETDITWVHFDLRYTRQSRILLVKG